MQRIVLIVGLWLALAGPVWAAETLSLVDGTSVSGTIVKFDDNGMMLRDTGDAYQNLPWARFSQDSLKHLAENPKIKPFVEVFIEPDQSTRPPRAEIKVKPVTRMTLPEHPSIIGGLLTSSLGWFILLVLYAANLYAAFEVAVIRARPPLQVMGLAAIVPIIAPAVFLALPTRVEPVMETHVAPEDKPEAAAFKVPGEPQIADASWKQEDDKKTAVQVFTRGKFTFNKRFIETKFAGYLGDVKGDAQNYIMGLKTPQGQFTVNRIVQVAAADVTFETVEKGALRVPLNDILEVKLTPKPAA